MAKEKPTYLVKVKDKKGDVIDRRIISADNPAHARNHVADNLIEVERTTSAILVELGKEGVEIEAAGR